MSKFVDKFQNLFSSDSRLNSNAGKKNTAILKSSTASQSKDEMPRMYFRNNFTTDTGGCVYSFSYQSDAIETFKLNAIQNKLYNGRLSRTFICSNLAEYKSRINKAESIEEVNKLGEKLGICDKCDFSLLALDAARNGLLAVLDSLVRFPELRSKTCFIGSDIALVELYQKFKNKDKTILASLGLEKIISNDDVPKLAKMLKSSIEYATTSSNMACAFSCGGFYDGIILREKNFSMNAYKKTLSDLYYSSNRAFAPKGCYTIKSVIDHEVGHMLDFSRSVSERREVIDYYKKLSATEIKNGLSEYASTDIKEFIAEGYSEFSNHYPPREMSKRIAAFIRDARK